MKQALLFFFCVFTVLSGSRSGETADAGSVSSVTIYGNKEFLSACSVIGELAAQMWAEDAKDGKTHFLTVQNDDLNFHKYTDGEYIVVSIPIASSDDIDGFCRFATDYNECNIRKADSLVKSGKYEEAKRIYQLLIHFDPNRGKISSLTKRLNERLAFLAKVEKHQDMENSIKKFAEPCGCGILTDLSKIKTIETTTVTNIFKVQIGQLSQDDDTK